MALTKEEIEALYSRVPLLRVPQTIYQLENVEVGADQLYDAAHKLNRATRHSAGGWRIFGFTKIGTDFITLAGNAPPTTPLHEAIHGMGLASEPATYAVTRFAMARARLNLGLFRRPVRYTQVEPTPAEKQAFFDMMHLSVAPGETGQPRLVKMVYTP
jgi:hypothetical protein